MIKVVFVGDGVLLRGDLASTFLISLIVSVASTMLICFISNVLKTTIFTLEQFNKTTVAPVAV